MSTQTFKDYVASAKKSYIYWAERAILEFVIELSKLMETRKVSRAELARMLGTSPAYITKVLRGDANFTVDSMVRLSWALGARLHIHLAEEDVSVRWFDIAQQQKSAHAGRAAHAEYFAGFSRPVVVKGDRVNGQNSIAA